MIDVGVSQFPEKLHLANRTNELGAKLNDK